jgi:cell division protein FtsN
VSEAETESPKPETEVDQPLPVEETNSFFIIAGSFKKLKNASDLQDQLNSRGFHAEVMITENRMYRVSVASYATKTEAEKELVKIKSQSGLQSCWLLSN